MTKISIRDMSIYGVYTALFLLMAFIPQIGYIKIGIINATLMAVPVAIISVHKGIPGAIFGLFMFAITSVLHELAFPLVALIGGYDKMFIAFFFGRLLIAVPLIPFMLLAKKVKMNKYLRSGLIGIIISVSNTLIVIGLMVALKLSEKSFWAFFVFVAINIWIEWTVPVFIAISTSGLAEGLSHKDSVEKNNRY